MTTTNAYAVIVPGVLVRAGIAHQRWQVVQDHLERLRDEVASGRSPPEAAIEQRDRLVGQRTAYKAQADAADAEFRRWCQHQGAYPES